MYIILTEGHLLASLTHINDPSPDNSVGQTQTRLWSVLFGRSFEPLAVDDFSTWPFVIRPSSLGTIQLIEGNRWLSLSIYSDFATVWRATSASNKTELKGKKKNNNGVSTRGKKNVSRMPQFLASFLLYASNGFGLKDSASLWIYDRHFSLINMLVMKQRDHRTINLSWKFLRHGRVFQSNYAAEIKEFVVSIWWGTTNSVCIKLSMKHPIISVLFERISKVFGKSLRHLRALLGRGHCA